jgi:hypothetical protein
LRRRVLLAVGLLVGCAASPAPATVPPAPPRPTAAPAPKADPPDAGPAPVAGTTIRVVEPDATMETKHLSEKQWVAQVREQLGKQLKVEPGELRFSPDRQWVVIVRGPPPPPEGKPIKHPRRYQIVVTDAAGKRTMKFRPVVAKGSDEPPKDVHFLADNRLIYEVVDPPPAPPPPPKPAAKGKAKASKVSRPIKVTKAPAKVSPQAAKPEARPTRLFVIQPLARRGRLIRCVGERFSFTAQQDHLAFVGGEPEASFVSVDGAQVYPRKGRTQIGGEPAWSRDGHSLAFLELRHQAASRLVLLAEYDNPSGDTTWDLPMSTALDGARVFWAGSGKLVVGRSSLKPIFAASFHKEKAPPTWREP